jgi:serine/threonine protein kinase
MENRVGQVVGGFRPTEALWHGDVGMVYRAEHLTSGARAAIKVRDRPLLTEDVAAFHAAAQTVAQLTHPHILPILDFGPEPGHIAYPIVALAPHGTLEDLLYRSRAPFPLPTACRYTTQVAAALQYSHNRQILHCNLHPREMLLDEQGKVLADFSGSPLRRAILGWSGPRLLLRIWRQRHWTPSGRPPATSIH